MANCVIVLDLIRTLKELLMTAVSFSTIKAFELLLSHRSRNPGHTTYSVSGTHTVHQIPHIYQMYNMAKSLWTITPICVSSTNCCHKLEHTVV